MQLMLKMFYYKSVIRPWALREAPYDVTQPHCDFGNLTALTWYASLACHAEADSNEAKIARAGSDALNQDT